MVNGKWQTARSGRLQATALVHEACVRLVDTQRVNWQSRAHFLAMPARLMRRVLVDQSPTGRPCGWSPDARTTYLLLDTDGFRCLGGQQLDARTGRASGPVFPVRHFHMQMDDGPSTSFGNAVSRAGFLYERTYRTGTLCRLAGRKPEAR